MKHALSIWSPPQPMEQVLLLPLFYRWQIWGLERLESDSLDSETGKSHPKANSQGRAMNLVLCTEKICAQSRSRKTKSQVHVSNWNEDINKGGRGTGKDESTVQNPKLHRKGRRCKRSCYTHTCPKRAGTTTICLSIVSSGPITVLAQ